MRRKGKGVVNRTHPSQQRTISKCKGGCEGESVIRSPCARDLYLYLKQTKNKRGRKGGVKHWLAHIIRVGHLAFWVSSDPGNVTIM